MANMLDHPGIIDRVKVLNAANSGVGKTGALASLVDAGFKLRVLDFDIGLTPLAGFVKDKAKLANVDFIELRDDFKLMGARMGIKKANGFSRAMDALETGKGWSEGIGPVTSWGKDTILVLDTLGLCGRSCLMMVMEANAAAMKAPEIQHYGAAMDNIEKMLALLTSPAVACHLIVNTHITTVDGYVQLFPDALGSKLSPKIGRYFDNMITIRADANGNREFCTKKDGLFICKTAVPLADKYPISDGWVSIFKGLLGPEAYKNLFT